MKCPICNKKLSVQEIRGEHGIDEEYRSCKKNHYWYEYSYGYTTVTVYGRTWDWSYNTEYQEISRIDSEIKEYIRYKLNEGKRDYDY